MKVFALISKKTPLSKLSFTFVLLALPLLPSTNSAIIMTIFKPILCGLHQALHIFEPQSRMVRHFGTSILLMIAFLGPPLLPLLFGWGQSVIWVCPVRSFEGFDTMFLGSNYSDSLPTSPPTGSLTGPRVCLPRSGLLPIPP
jgi:hypothetical protein